MAKKTIEELHAIREQAKAALHNRDNADKNIFVNVGMGASGIEAGAKLILKAFNDEINLRGIKNVAVRQVGFMGLLNEEPTVMVSAPNLPKVIYGKVDQEFVKTIIDKHLIGNQLIQDRICQVVEE